MKIDSEDIACIRRKLIRPRRTKPSKKNSSADIRSSSAERNVDQPAETEPSIERQPIHNQLNWAQRRDDDSKFKPPVPLPVRFVDVKTMDTESEL